MTHFAGAEFTVDFRFDVNVERIGNVRGDFANGHTAAATDIYRQSIECVGFSREQIRARDIFDKREVARLLAIFKKTGGRLFKRRVQKIAITPV